LDTDFRGRSVLSIICHEGFAELMCEEDIKAEEMIKDFWTGKEAENCDGDMFGFSNMAHILFEKQ